MRRRKRRDSVVRAFEIMTPFPTRFAVVDLFGPLGQYLQAMDLAFWAQIAAIGSFLLSIILAINKFWPDFMKRAMQNMARWKFPLLFAALGIFFALVWYKTSPAHLKSTGDFTISSTPLIPPPNAKYEAYYKEYKEDAGKMSQAGYDAFHAGDFAYCAMFYKQADDDDPNGSWQANRAFWYGAMLAQNPTGEGYRHFHLNLDDLVGTIRGDLKGGKGFFTYQQVLISLRTNLGEVKHLLPESEKGHLEDAVTQIEVLQKSCPN